MRSLPPAWASPSQLSSGEVTTAASVVALERVEQYITAVTCAVDRVIPAAR
jgi:hypothetical protein